jgi:hypothetical protein
LLPNIALRSSQLQDGRPALRPGGLVELTPQALFPNLPDPDVFRTPSTPALRRGDDEASCLSFLVKQVFG